MKYSAEELVALERAKVDPLAELRIAREILAEIPDEKLDLECIANKTFHSCETIACGAGWLALHPRYQARGFALYDGGAVGICLYEEGRRTQYWPPAEYGMAMSEMLGLPSEHMETLFSVRGFAPLEPLCEIVTDKQVLLRRIDNYVAEHST